MVEPSLAKAVSRWYIPLIHWDDINHMPALHVLNVTYISHISHPYIIKSRLNFSHKNCSVNGKCLKKEVIYIAKVTEENGNLQTYTILLNKDGINTMLHLHMKM